MRLRKTSPTIQQTFNPLARLRVAMSGIEAVYTCAFESSTAATSVSLLLFDGRRYMLFDDQMLCTSSQHQLDWRLFDLDCLESCIDGYPPGLFGARILLSHVA